jgi:hypothetical protein
MAGWHSNTCAAAVSVAAGARWRPPRAHQQRILQQRLGRRRLGRRVATPERVPRGHPDRRGVQQGQALPDGLERQQQRPRRGDPVPDDLGQERVHHRAQEMGELRRRQKSDPVEDGARGHGVLAAARQDGLDVRHAETMRHVRPGNPARRQPVRQQQLRMAGRPSPLR